MPISENYTHRAEVRASLASNQEWIDEYFSKLLPMLTSQTNVGLISMENGSKPDVIYPEGQGGFFLLRKFREIKLHTMPCRSQSMIIEIKIYFNNLFQ